MHRITDRLRNRVPAGALAPAVIFLLIFLAFWQFFLRGEVIAPTDLLLSFRPWSFLAEDGHRVENSLRSDIVDGYLPTLSEFQDGLRGGDFVSWSPLQAQGRPIGASLNSTILNPLVFISLLLFPLAQAFSLIVIGKMACAGGFMYMALRRWKLSRGAALVGGIAYMFSGFNIVWLMWPHTLVTAFAPLLFYAVEGVVLDPGPKKTAILGIAVALLIVGGFPSVTAYFFTAAGLYIVVRLAHQQIKTSDWRSTLGAAAGFTVAFGLGIGLTAVQLLPTRDYADFADLSHRDHLSNAHLPYNQLVQLVFPNYNGNQVFGNFQGHINLNESSGYVGTVTLGLALLGAAAGTLRRRVVPIFFAMLAVFCVLIIYNIGPFLEIISHFPIFDTNPSIRLLSVFGFAAAALGAFGLDELRGLRLGGVFRPVALVLATIGVAVLVGALGYLIYEIIGRWSFVAAFLDDFPIMDIDAFRPVTVALAVALSLAFSVAALAHLWRPLPAKALVLVAVIVIGIDVLFFAYRQNPTTAEADFYPEPPSIEFLSDNLSPGERMISFNMTFLFPGTQGYYGISGALSHSLYSERQRNLIESFVEDAFKTHTTVLPWAANTDFSSPAFDLLGLKYLTFVPGTGPPMADTGLGQRYELVYSHADELDIYEYGRYQEAFLVTDVVVEGEGKALALVTDPRFDPVVSGVVEEDPPEWFEASTVNTSKSVRLQKYGNDSLTFEVTTERPALLVTHEMYFPGWEVSVDGEKQPVYRSDYLLRGVFVEPGVHLVTFEYRPASQQAGLVISVVSAVALAALFSHPFAWPYLRRRLTWGE